jgi:hypothetical protein
MPKNFTVRLPDADADLVEEIAAGRGETSAEVLREALGVYLRGEAKSFKGPDAGYVAGRALAVQLAFELLREATEGAPTTVDAAQTYLAKRRKRKVEG